MSWSVSAVAAYTDVACPGVVWCLWTATRSTDGAFADVGACFNAAYSIVPGYNPDGSVRSISGGLYVGFTAIANTTVDVNSWGFFATGLVSAVDPSTRTFTPGLDSDSDALTNVPLTVSDSAVTSAVSAALTAASFVGIGWATSGNVEFDGYGALASVSTSVGDTTYAGGLILSSSGPGTPIISEPASFTSDNVAVMTVAQTGDTFALTFVATGSCNLIALFPSAAAPGLGQTIPVTVT